MVVEQKVAEQVAMVSRAEHNLNEERATFYRGRQDSDVFMRNEIEEMKQEHGRLRIELMAASKDAGALNRQLMEKDDEVRQLRVALQEANSAPSMSSWMIPKSIG